MKLFGPQPLLENHRIAMNANSVYDAWFPCIMQTLRATVIALVIFIGASNNTTSIALGLSLGTLAAAADLLIRLFDPIEAAANGIQTIQQAMAGLNRIKAYFSQEIETARKMDETDSSKVDDVTVVVENVRFAYKNGKDVLKVLQSIRNISNSKTIITISHRLSGIIDANTVHIMERGRIVESGNPQALARKEGWYSRYKRLEDRNWRIS